MSSEHSNIVLTSSGDNGLDDAYDFLKEAIHRTVGGYSQDSLLRDDLGPFTFRNMNATISCIWEMLGELENVPPQLIGIPRLRELARTVDAVRSTFDHITAFDVRTGNIIERRANLQKELYDHWGDLSALITPFAAYARVQKLSRIEESLSTLSSEAAARIQDARAQFDQLQKDVRITLEAAKNAAAEAGITSQAEYFKAEADEHRRFARQWLAAACVFLFGTIAYTIFRLEPQLRDLTSSNPSAGVATFIPGILTRLIIVSLLWFGLVWTTRQYNASRHNFVVNRHRQNAISSFMAFVEGTKGDAQTRNAILLQATQSIFIPQSSGYVKTETEPSLGSPVIEIMRNVGGGKET